MDTVYKLLQSGFIGRDSSDLVQIPERQKTLTSSLTTQSGFKLDTSNYYDQAVDQLYDQLTISEKVLNDFQFRETLLKKAYALFGEKTFIGWFQAQYKSPGFSYLHERFLKETLLYIYDNKNRAMSQSSYVRLLHVGQRQSIFSTDDELREYKELNSILSNLNNATTTSLLASWTCNMEGLQDLLFTMNVIFGKRAPQAAF